MTYPRNRILFVHNQPNIGGGERSLLLLFQELLEKYELFLACPPEGKFAEAVDALGIGIFPFRFGGVRNISALIMNIYRLVHIIRKNDIALVHGNSPQVNIACGMAGMIAGIPIVWHARVLLEAGMIDLDRLFSFLPQKIICNSKAIGRRFAGIRNENAKVEIIVNGVDTQYFKPEFISSDDAKARLGISSDRFVMGCFDRLDPVKDHETILHAVKSVYDGFPGVILLVVGEAFDQPEKRKKALADLAERLGIIKCVRFVGFQQDIRESMAACDLVVQASKSEGCSRVICEAHAMGKPVAASDVGGNPEIVINGVTGLLFPVGNSVELADCIRNFIADETLINQMGMSGRRQAVSALSVQRYCHEMERVYHLLEKV